MPLLISQDEIRMEWTDANSRCRHPLPASHQRTPGVHLSGVLRHVALKSGILATPGVPNVDSTRRQWLQHDIDEDEMPLRMMFGMFFEEGMAGLYPDMNWQPGEMQKDGVFGTPDGISIIQAQGNGSASNASNVKRVDDYIYVLDEFKLTWKSEWNYGKEKFLGGNWLWMGQAKGYLAMAQDAGYPISHVRFHIGWVNGDYRPPQPKVIRYLVKFSDSEVANFWSNVILKNRDNPEVAREGEGVVTK